MREGRARFRDGDQRDHHQRPQQVRRGVREGCRSRCRRVMCGNADRARVSCAHLIATVTVAAQGQRDEQQRQHKEGASGLARPLPEVSHWRGL